MTPAAAFADVGIVASEEAHLAFRDVATRADSGRAARTATRVDVWGADELGGCVLDVRGRGGAAAVWGVRTCAERAGVGAAERGLCGVVTCDGRDARAREIGGTFSDDREGRAAVQSGAPRTRSAHALAGIAVREQRRAMPLGVGHDGLALVGGGATRGADVQDTSGRCAVGGCERCAGVVVGRDVGCGIRHDVDGRGVVARVVRRGVVVRAGRGVVA